MISTSDLPPNGIGSILPRLIPSCIGLSLVLAFIYAQNFSNLVLPFSVSYYGLDFLAFCYAASSVLHLIGLFVLALKPHFAHSKPLLLAACAVCACAILVPRLLIESPGSSMQDILLLVSAGLTGLSSSFISVSWLARISRLGSRQVVTFTFITAYLLSILLFSLIVHLPYSFGFAIMVMLIPSSTGIILSFPDGDGGIVPTCQKPELRTREKSFASDIIRFAVGIALLGALFVMVKDAAFSYGDSLFLSMEWGFYGSAVLFSAFLIVCFKVLGRVISFRTIIKVVTPLLLGAFLVLVGLGNNAASGALALMVCGYTCFEAAYLLYVLFACDAREVDATRCIAISRAAQVAGIPIGAALSWFTNQGELFSSSGTVFWMAASYLVIMVASLVFSNQATANFDSDGQHHSNQEAQLFGEKDARVLQALTQANKLTPREAEVFELLAAGRSIPHIAERLYIAPGTVKTHVKSIYRKIGVGDKQALLDYVEEYQMKLDKQDR